MNSLKKNAGLLITGLSICFAVSSQTQWPKEIPLSSGGKITIYQPQPETLDGNKSTGRAAISVKKTASDEPLFGAIWYKATFETNKDDRTAALQAVEITKAKFSDSVSQADLDNLSGIIEEEVPKWNMEFSLDDMLTSIREEQQINDANLKNDPPKIIYETRPTTLVSIDGAPQVKKDENLKMDRVLNTPFLIIRYPGDNKYYLYAQGFWYNSSSITNGYTYVKNLPSKLNDVDKQIKEQENKDDSNAQGERPTKPTDIIISTEPAELIQTEGEASYKSIQGTSLLYADNTLDEIFKDINSQNTFTLISGRWYSAPNLNGPWVYTPSDKLPVDFAKIPKGSEKDGVLANVAGTDEANDAVTDAQIPQTVKVDRKAAKCTVTYDGSPKFSKIENTSLEVAENSNITVMKAANDKYYAVDNGIWFISSDPTGPWEVANERPQDVEKIPPSNEAYNTKYVYVYDNTPDYVYMGYTPGYMGCYVYGPTVVYGTGWYYSPWYGSIYYPSPVTYGFGFNYNPWTGWNMSWGTSFNFGWFHFGFGPSPGFGGWYGGGGWFGPPMYRPPYCGWGWHGGYYGHNTVIVNRPNIVVNRPVNINVNNVTNIRNNININNRTNNIYNSRVGASTKDVSRSPATASRPTIGRPSTSVDNNDNRLPATRPVARPSNTSNNVFTDRNGNVFKNDKGSWQQRDNKTWKPATQDKLPDLNKDKTQRDRGNIRDNNFNQAQKQVQRPVQRPAPKPPPQPAPRKP